MEIDMQKIFRPIAFLILLGVVLMGTYRIVSWKDTTGDYQSSTQQLYNTDKDLIDVVFLGSSHCYTNIYPSLLWRDYGYSAFDMAVSGQDKNSTYHDLVEVLKTQHPKVVCVDVYGLLFEEQAVRGNVYRNMLALRTSKNSMDLVKAYVDEEEWGDFFLRWPIVHTRYRELDRYDFITNDINVFGRGEEVSWSDGNGYAPIDAYYCNETADLSETNTEWINKIYDLSIEYDFQLVFFMAPFAATVEDQKTINMLALHAEDMGVPFIDFNKIYPLIGYDFSTDASDPFHSDAEGAAKVTGYFGQYLAENYDLADHRGDDKYAQWETNYNYYLHKEQEHILDKMETFDDYLKYVAVMNDVTVIISLDGYYEWSMDKLGYFGVDKEEYMKGGKWILVDGEITHVIDADSETSYTLDVSEYDSFLLQNADDVMNDVMYGMTPVCTTSDGLNIIVYDNFQEKIISMRGE